MVFIVDGIIFNVMALELHFQYMKNIIKIEKAYNGLEEIEIIEREMAHNEKNYDETIILMDIYMPEMNGYEIT